jgi:soluble lytic murein transglycosylase-like protein
VHACASIAIKGQVMRSLFVIVASFVLASRAMAGIAGLAGTCWDEAAQRYGVSAQLLYAFARVESSLDPQAVNWSHVRRTGTHDIGLMQINSGHLPALQRHGITESDLQSPCINIHVGAKLMADNFARLGVNWNAVGAYNAVCTELKGQDCAKARAIYAWKVYRNLPSRLAAKARPLQTLPPPSQSSSDFLPLRVHVSMRGQP